MWERIKVFVSDDGLFYSVLIVLIGVTAFGLGRWSVDGEPQSNQPASIIFSSDNNTLSENSSPETKNVVSGASDVGSVTTAGMYVGSKNSDKYHLPHCSGAQRIKESNKVWFASKEEAEAAGYTPAGNCPGL